MHTQTPNHKLTCPYPAGHVVCKYNTLRIVPGMLFVQFSLAGTPDPVYGYSPLLHVGMLWHAPSTTGSARGVTSIESQIYTLSLHKHTQQKVVSS